MTKQERRNMFRVSPWDRFLWDLSQLWEFLFGGS